MANIIAPYSSEAKIPQRIRIYFIESFPVNPVESKIVVFIVNFLLSELQVCRIFCLTVS